nr:MAG TPA: Flagellar C1a complex subunit C1a-32 [Caudoviricetes sp.]
MKHPFFPSSSLFTSVHLYQFVLTSTREETREENLP